MSFWGTPHIQNKTAMAANFMVYLQWGEHTLTHFCVLTFILMSTLEGKCSYYLLLAHTERKVQKGCTGQGFPEKQN